VFEQPFERRLDFTSLVLCGASIDRSVLTRRLGPVAISLLRVDSLGYCPLYALFDEGREHLSYYLSMFVCGGEICKDMALEDWLVLVRYVPLNRSDCLLDYLQLYAIREYSSSFDTNLQFFRRVVLTRKVPLLQAAISNYLVSACNREHELTPFHAAVELYCDETNIQKMEVEAQDLREPEVKLYESLDNEFPTALDEWYHLQHIYDDLPIPNSFVSYSVRHGGFAVSIPESALDLRFQLSTEIERVADRKFSTPISSRVTYFKKPKYSSDSTDPAASSDSGSSSGSESSKRQKCEVSPTGMKRKL
jgi:hypothetical protein